MCPFTLSQEREASALAKASFRTSHGYGRVKGIINYNAKNNQLRRGHGLLLLRSREQGYEVSQEVYQLYATLMEIQGPDRKVMLGVQGVAKSIIRSVIGFEEWVLNNQKKYSMNKVTSIDGLQGEEERLAVKVLDGDHEHDERRDNDDSFGGSWQDESNYLSNIVL